MKIPSLTGLHFALMLALSGTAGLASAQYAWVDANGQKQFSDMPPPASVSRKNILREPTVKPVAATGKAPGKADAEPAGTASPPASDAPITTAERNADFQKRKMEQADKDQKAAEAARLAASKAADCEKARSYARSLDDGMRIVTTGKDGERSTMSDEQRAIEQRNVRKVINECS